MERNQLEIHIKKAMDLDAMGLQEPSAELVEAARFAVASRKKPLEKSLVSLSWLLMLFTGRLRFYQLGFSVLVTSLCLFYALQITVRDHSRQGFSTDSPGSLSIKNTTISVNSSTLLTSIPTLRN